MNNDHPPTQISKICGHFGRATPTNHHSRSQRGVVIIHPDDISMIVPCFDVYFWLYIPIVYMIFPGIPLSIYIYISPEDFSGHHLADRRTGVGLAAQATRIHFFQIPMVMTHHPGHSGTSLEVMPMAGNVPLRASNKWDGRKRKAVEMGDIFLEMRGRVISSKWSYGLLDCFWSPVSRGWSSSGKTTETTAHPMKNVEVSVEFPRPTNLCLSLTGNLAQPVLLASDLDAFWVLMTRSSTKWYKSDSSPRFLWCMLFQLGSHQSVNQNCWALQDLREILKILML